MSGYSLYHNLPRWPFLNQLISLNLSRIIRCLFCKISVKLNTLQIWRSLDKIRQVIYIQTEGRSVCKDLRFWHGKLLLGHVTIPTYSYVAVPGWKGIMNIYWSLTAEDVIEF